jgi:hypothetical protein
MNSDSLVFGFVCVLIRARVEKSKEHLPDLKPDYSGPVFKNSGYLSLRMDLMAFSVIFHKLDNIPIGRMSFMVLITFEFILLRCAILH